MPDERRKSRFIDKDENDLEALIGNIENIKNKKVEIIQNDTTQEIQRKIQKLNVLTD